MTVNPHDDPAPADYYRHPRAELLALLSQFGPFSGRALDIGCGEGIFGSSLGTLGFDDVWGVEPAEGPAEAATRRLGRVIASPFPTDAALDGAPFSLVVFADSLEHMEDPWEALRFARKLLAPRGLLLISSPNVAHYHVVRQLLRGRFDYADAGLLDRAHLRFFTSATLVEAVQEVGCGVVAVWDYVTAPQHAWVVPVTGFIRRCLPALFVSETVLLARPQANTCESD